MTTSSKTCGRCRHLDGAPVETQTERQVRYCELLKVWTYALSPRGELGPFHCDKWSPILAGPDNMS